MGECLSIVGVLSLDRTFCLRLLHRLLLHCSVFIFDVQFVLISCGLSEYGCEIQKESNGFMWLSVGLSRPVAEFSPLMLNLHVPNQCINAKIKMSRTTSQQESETQPPSYTSACDDVTCDTVFRT